MSEPMTTAELDGKFNASVKAIGDGIDRLQRTNALLVEALNDARGAIDTLGEDDFGLVIDHHTGNLAYPVRDELLAKIDAALAEARRQA